MANMQLKQASRKQSKLRIGLSWPSWSGKTYSALQIAFWLTGDWGKIAVIDTENGSADLYSNLWEYNTLTLEAPFSPERYIEAIHTCEDAGMEVIIIDSTSHEWEWKWWCLEINDVTAQTKFRWNTWSAWSQTTPRHQRFIEAITQSSCHIITTARSKTDTIQTEDKKIKKVWTKDIQREWFEYEMTLMFNIDRDWHLAIASKDRTNLFIDRDAFLINSKIWQEIKEWNLSWIKEKPLEEIQQENYEKYFELLQNCTDLDTLKSIYEEIKVNKFNQPNLDELSEIIKNIKTELTKE